MNIIIHILNTIKHLLNSPVQAPLTPAEWAGFANADPALIKVNDEFIERRLRS